MYFDRSSLGYAKDDKFIDEINFKNFMRLKRKTTGNLFVGITYKKRKFIINLEYLDANNISSHLFIQNLKYKANMVQYLSRKMKISI